MKRWFCLISVSYASSRVYSVLDFARGRPTFLRSYRSPDKIPSSFTPTLNFYGLRLVKLVILKRSQHFGGALFTISLIADGIRIPIHPSKRVRLPILTDFVNRHANLTVQAPSSTINIGIRAALCSFPTILRLRYNGCTESLISHSALRLCSLHGPLSVPTHGRRPQFYCSTAVEAGSK